MMVHEMVHETVLEMVQDMEVLQFMCSLEIEQYQVCGQLLDELILNGCVDQYDDGGFQLMVMLSL
jgi:hypothetical protein